jgi:hypothetical protein
MPNQSYARQGRVPDSWHYYACVCIPRGEWMEAEGAALSQYVRISETYIEAIRETLWLLLWALPKNQKEMKIMSTHNIATDPTKYKVRILKHLGMTDKEKVEAHLLSKTNGITNEAKLSLRLDIVCRSMIENFYNGDKSFVKRN